MVSSSHATVTVSALLGQAIVLPSSIGHICTEVADREATAVQCCRVPVPGQADPIICITCISHASSQATAKPTVAAPAAELQLEDIGGDDGELEGGLQSSQSAEAAAPDVLAGQCCCCFCLVLPCLLLLLLLLLGLLLLSIAGPATTFDAQEQSISH